MPTQQQLEAASSTGGRAHHDPPHAHALPPPPLHPLPHTGPLPPARPTSTCGSQSAAAPGAALVPMDPRATALLLSRSASMMTDDAATATSADLDDHIMSTLDTDAFDEQGIHSTCASGLLHVPAAAYTASLLHGFARLPDTDRERSAPRDRPSSSSSINRSGGAAGAHSASAHLTEALRGAGVGGPGGGAASGASSSSRQCGQAAGNTLARSGEVLLPKAGAASHDTVFASEGPADPHTRSHNSRLRHTIVGSSMSCAVTTAGAAPAPGGHGPQGAAAVGAWPGAGAGYGAGCGPVFFSQQLTGNPVPALQLPDFGLHAIAMGQGVALNLPHATPLGAPGVPVPAAAAAAAAAASVAGASLGSSQPTSACALLHAATDPTHALSPFASPAVPPSVPWACNRVSMHGSGSSVGGLFNSMNQLSIAGSVGSIAAAAGAAMPRSEPWAPFGLASSIAGGGSRGSGPAAVLPHCMFDSLPDLDALEDLRATPIMEEPSAEGSSGAPTRKTSVAGPDRPPATSTSSSSLHSSRNGGQDADQAQHVRGNGSSSGVREGGSGGGWRHDAPRQRRHGRTVDPEGLEAARFLARLSLPGLPAEGEAEAQATACITLDGSSPSHQAGVQRPSCSSPSDQDSPLADPRHPHHLARGHAAEAVGTPAHGGGGDDEDDDKDSPYCPSIPPLPPCPALEPCGVPTVDRYLQQLLQDRSAERHMFLCKRHLGAAACRAVAACLRAAPGVRSITLSHCGITCEGLTALCEGLHTCASCVILDLSNNAIGNMGAAALAACLPDMRSLVNLQLVSNPELGDPGVGALAAAARSCPTLRRIGMRGTATSAGELRELNALLNGRTRRTQPGRRADAGEAASAAAVPGAGMVPDAPAAWDARKGPACVAALGMGLGAAGAGAQVGRGGGMGPAALGGIASAACGPVRGGGGSASAASSSSGALGDDAVFVAQLCGLLRSLVQPALPAEMAIAAVVAELLAQWDAGDGEAAAEVAGSGGSPDVAAPLAAAAAAAIAETPGSAQLRQLRSSLSRGRTVSGPPSPVPAAAAPGTARSTPTAADKHGSLLSYLAEGLTASGYGVAVTHTLGGGAGNECLRNLRHTYLSVTLPRRASSQPGSPAGSPSAAAGGGGGGAATTLAAASNAAAPSGADAAAAACSSGSLPLMSASTSVSGSATSARAAAEGAGSAAAYEHVGTIIVDPELGAQFDVASPTPRYGALVGTLPRVYVGAEERLPLVVEVLCDELALAFRSKGIVLPPWRESSSMISKWQPKMVSSKLLIPAGSGATDPGVTPASALGPGTARTSAHSSAAVTPRVSAMGGPAGAPGAAAAGAAEGAAGGQRLGRGSYGFGGPTVSAASTQAQQQMWRCESGGISCSAAAASAAASAAARAADAGADGAAGVDLGGSMLASEASLGPLPLLVDVERLQAGCRMTSGGSSQDGLAASGGADVTDGGGGGGRTRGSAGFRRCGSEAMLASSLSFPRSPMDAD